MNAQMQCSGTHSRSATYCDQGIRGWSLIQQPSYAELQPDLVLTQMYPTSGFVQDFDVILSLQLI